MNEDTMKGGWTQMKGKLRQAWGDLTDDDLAKLKGEREELVGFLQKKYGESREAIEEKLSKLK